MKMKKIYVLIILFLIAGLLASHTNSAPKFVIAVLDFKEATGDASYRYLKVAVPEIFATNLAQATGITILERDRVKKILKEAGLIMAGIAKGDEKKIGKLLAAKQLLSGTIIKAGRQLRLDVRLIDVTTGKILAADKRRCKDMDDIIDAVDILSEKIVERITGKRIVFAKDIERNQPKIRGDLIEMEMLTQNTYHRSNSREPFFVRVGFYAKKVEKKKERLPLNVAIVLDRSGSMSSEGKLAYAKKAIQFIIKNLNRRDTVSVVTYDDKVDVILPPTKALDKKMIEQLISKIEPGGSTNLSGGLLEGFSMVRKNLRTGQINRVLLISDGLANVGITDPKRIQEITNQRTRGGITVSTFGVGQFFNEKLLTGIAEYGSANYYYIDQSDKIPEIFSRELEGLLAVVAQNCTIRIKSRNGTSVENVYGYKFQSAGDEVIIKMGDVVSEEKKLALVKLMPPKKDRGLLSIARITFSYDDAISDKGRIDKRGTVSISYTESRALIEKNINAVIMKEADMFISSAMMEETMDLVDRGDIDSAKKKIDDNLRRVRSGLSRYRSKEMKKQAMNIIEYQLRLEEAREKGSEMSADSFQRMQKAGRSKQYQLRKKK
jgi:Ca-activated chloride channel family protein